MSKFQTILLALLAAVVATVILKLAPEAKEIAACVGMLATALVGWAVQHPADKAQANDAKRDPQAGHATPALMLTGAFLVPAVLIGLALPSMSCKQVKPDQFFEAVVDCAKVNPETSAATSAVLTCITGAVSGNPSACLSGLVTEAHWTVDEVACIVADIAQRENKKVQLDGDPKAAHARGVAVDWLVRERIAIRNTYAGAP